MCTVEKERESERGVENTHTDSGMGPPEPITLTPRKMSAPARRNEPALGRCGMCMNCFRRAPGDVESSCCDGLAGGGDCTSSNEDKRME